MHRYKHVDDHAPHIDEEIADVRIAAKCADDCRQSAEPDCCREELVGNAEKDLAEVGEMLVSA